MSKALEGQLTAARAHMDADEAVTAAVLGVYESTVMGTRTYRRGVLIASPRRLLFFSKRLFKNFEVESFPYSKISSFETSKTLLGHKFTFFASGNRVSIIGVREGDIEGFTRTVRARMETGSDGEGARPDVVGQIERLAKLRETGALSAEEFDAQKRKLLQ